MTLTLGARHLCAGSLASALALVSFAIAQTPCPDPKMYTRIHGSCTPSGCLLIPPGGFHAVRYSTTPGGCITPGNSAYECEVKSIILNVTDVRASFPFRNGCGQFVYATCDRYTLTIFGLKYGESNLQRPCNYE